MKLGRDFHTYAMGGVSPKKCTVPQRRDFQLQETKFPKAEFKSIQDQLIITGRGQEEVIAFNSVNIKDILRATHTKIVKRSFPNLQGIWNIGGKNRLTDYKIQQNIVYSIIHNM